MSERTHIPLVNIPRVKKQRKPIPRVTKKRRGQNAEYLRRRKAFLEKHPYCMVWLIENNFTEEQSKLWGGWVRNGLNQLVSMPKSTEIHHMRKPKCKYLNDESTWLAVSREMHDKIEANKAWARHRGYIMNN